LTVALGVCVLLLPGTDAAALLPPPPTGWMNITGTLAGMASECGNLTLLSATQDSDTIVAGVAHRGLWANNRGNSWAPLKGAHIIANRPSWIVYDPERPSVFWESGIYNGGGVYLTTDNGTSFRQLGSISHIDFVSVNFRDPERQTLLAGGHERAQTVYLSSDGGQTWTNIGVNLPAGSGASTHPLVLNSLTYVVNAGTVHRTTNGGDSWRQVSTERPTGPPLVTTNGAIYWPANGGLLKSTDLGATWTHVGKDLQAVRPVELSDGRLVAVGATHLVISADAGKTWSPFGASLPFVPEGLIYSPSRRAFFVWHSDCGPVVLPDAVMEIR
jgi:hypothetical protein